MDQRILGDLVSELAQRLDNKQKFGASITNEYIAEIVDYAIAEFRDLPNFQIEEMEVELIKFKLGSMFNIRVGEHAITLHNPDIPRWFEAKKLDIDWSYWNSYESMLVSQARSKEVLKENERVLDMVLDFSGDPTNPGPWSRKGLVMGNVQSGKTQNYLGLINKAVDAGYKIIILLGGHLNDLRKQTQERVDEGVVGRESKHLVKTQKIRPKSIGVGKFRDSSKNFHTFTTTEGDFSIKFANTLGVNLTGLSEPAIFTVKKNTKVMKNLYEWIRDHHLLNPAEGKRLDLPMLLIDDEADYASVNTKSHIDEVTATNEYIRNILSLFDRNTYVGYTATPFANIFIDPETADKAIHDDLFPKDFMVKIPVPENYVGQEYFFGPEPKGTNVISDCDNLLNLKSEDHIGHIPESLKEAVRAFLINIAIRGLRGEKYSHNTMLVNVSHLKVHQNRLEILIEQYRDQLKEAIEVFGGLGFEEARKNETLASIEDTYNTRFDVGETYQSVFSELKRAIGVKVWAVNQGNRTLDYSLYQEFGLRVIVIGGHRLSRGLTLEGLSVSYFTRNSKAYDTLMQMCRWFGYRPRYTDLCKVYLPYESLHWYSFITASIGELYSELDLMSRSEKRPSEFGLKVRDHPGAMVITAKNKMSSAESEIRSQDLWGQIMRRFRFRKNRESNQANLIYTMEYIASLESEVRESDKREEKKTGAKIYSNVPYGTVIQYIENMDLPEDDVGNQALIRQLKSMSEENLSLPHVCIFNQKKTRKPHWQDKLTIDEQTFLKTPQEIEGLSLNLAKRALKDDGAIYTTPKVQLGNPDDEKLFLSEDAIKSVLAEKKNAASFQYIAHEERDFPGLIIYLFGIGITTPYSAKKGDDYTAKLGFGCSPTVGFSVSLPRPEHLKGKDSNELKRILKNTRHSYLVNRVYQEQLSLLDLVEADEDE